MSFTLAERQMPITSRARESWTTRVWRAVYWALITRSSRQNLAKLDDRMLADIGASRSDAVWEASRPIWDIEVKTRPSAGPKGA